VREYRAYEAEKLTALRQEGKDAAQLLIVGISASGDADIQKNCKEAGMSAFVAKPVTHQKLSDVLLSVLKRRSKAK
jgi:CheY-like chemotaxis protein